MARAEAVGTEEAVTDSGGVGGVAAEAKAAGVMADAARAEAVEEGTGWAVMGEATAGEVGLEWEAGKVLRSSQQHSFENNPMLI